MSFVFSVISFRSVSYFFVTELIEKATLCLRSAGYEHPPKGQAMFGHLDKPGKTEARVTLQVGLDAKMWAPWPIKVCFNTEKAMQAGMDHCVVNQSAPAPGGK